VIWLAEAAAVSQRIQLWVCMLLIVAGAVIAYLPFMELPFLSDSYLQVHLGRKYGPIEQWRDLASDVLYRCRATSIVLTHLMDQLAGPDPFMHRSLNLLVHCLNSLLVAGLGFWKRIGWGVAIPAGVFFGLSEGHQEAVIWVAALPELLVFFFVLVGIHAWLQGLKVRSNGWMAVSAGCYLLALLSKESGIVMPALCAGLWWWEARQWRAPIVVIGLMGVVGGFYALGIFEASASHLHLNDGTFHVGAPFVVVLAKSTFRMLIPWGWICIAMLLALRREENRAILAMSLVWIGITLLPYSFLTYMDRVPSRHTYLASVGMAMVVGAAFWRVRLEAGKHKRVLAGMLAAVICGQSIYYLWTKKLEQYKRRVEPTETFLRFVKEVDRTPIQIRCAPYGYEVFRYAAVIRLGLPADFVVGPNDVLKNVEIRPYCDPSKP
jgi:hypothetical protein